MTEIIVEFPSKLTGKEKEMIYGYKGELVRCKDCKEYIPWAGDYICGRIGSYYGNTKPNDFCSFGERSEE